MTRCLKIRAHHIDFLFFSFLNSFLCIQVGVANGFLYALGGHDCPTSNPSVSRTDTVERYDPATDTWTLV